MNLYQASFLNSVREYPNNTALYTEENSGKANISSAKTFTYKKLFELSQQWGDYIAHFNKQQSPVAIYGGRQWQMYAGILAVLSTNSAYVPLNNKQPVARNSKVLSQIDCQVLLVAENEDPLALLQLTKRSLTVIYLGSDTPKWLSKKGHHTFVKMVDTNSAVPPSNTRTIAAQLHEADIKLNTTVMPFILRGVK